MSFQQSGQSIGQPIKGCKGKLAKLNCIDIKLLLDKRTDKNNWAVCWKKKFKFWSKTGMTDKQKKTFDRKQ
jgi:hypothetical protein